MDPAFDASAFRRALGSFATGVTVITTRAADGTPLGLTANSFNSVSLDPPLVLWSLANSAMSFEAFRSAQHWAVHVLTADQEALSARFARRGENKFEGLSVDQGLGGAPLLRDCAARFQCRTASTYQGGDHLIFIGEVLACDTSPGAPLVFHGGRYAHATRRDAPGDKPRSAQLAGSFGEDFLGYLLGRGHHRFFAQIRPHLAQLDLSDGEFYVLCALTLREALSGAELVAGMAGVLDAAAQDALHALLHRGLAQRQDADHYALSESGRTLALRLISAAKAVESQVLERLGAADAVVLKSLLKRLLGEIDPAAESLWPRNVA